MLPPIEPDEVRERIREYCEPLIAAGMSPTIEVEEGDPVKVITRIAGDTAPDLLIMGTHGRGGVQRLLLGSVTERIPLSLRRDWMRARHPDARVVAGWDELPVDFDDPHKVVDYGGTGRVKLTTLTKEFFVPGFLERDEGERERPYIKYPWDGVSGVRRFHETAEATTVGVY